MWIGECFLKYLIKVLFKLLELVSFSIPLLYYFSEIRVYEIWLGNILLTTRQLGPLCLIARTLFIFGAVING